MYSQEERPMENYSGQKDLLTHETPVFTGADYAGFWLRFAAYFIDAIVVYVVIFIFTMVFGLSFFGLDTDSGEMPGVGFFGPLAILYLGIILYFPLMESSKWQATLGKRAVGIIVTDLDGRRISVGKAFGRFFSKIISGIILYIGFIMAGFTERKQGLHDIIAGTLVIRGNRK
jgi:uncharacterized RDD family membrane protein YckC